MFSRFEESPYVTTIFIPRYPLAHGWATSKLPNLAPKPRSTPQEPTSDCGIQRFDDEHHEYMSVLQIDGSSPCWKDMVPYRIH